MSVKTFCNICGSEHPEYRNYGVSSHSTYISTNSHQQEDFIAVDNRYGKVLEHVCKSCRSFLYQAIKAAVDGAVKDAQRHNNIKEIKKPARSLLKRVLRTIRRRVCE